MAKRRLQFAKFDKQGIPLSELIAVHRQFPSKLAGNLGDGFLLATNPVFRNVREAYLKRGFRFTQANTANYFAFPLMALDDLIDARVIPYRENVSWLLRMEKAAPGKFTLTEMKRAELKFNYLFHEAAHFVAHDLFFGKKKVKSAPKTAATLLKVFLGEAFANSVEALASLYGEGEIGAYFLDANCHFRANEREAKTLEKAVKKIGAERTALVLMGAFLYSNYLFERLNPKQMKNIARLAGVETVAGIKSLIQIGLELNEDFRANTTPLHLVKTGFPVNLAPLTKKDPVQMVLDDKKLMAAVMELARIATKGVHA